MLFSNVLVAYDGSETARLALDQGFRLAGQDPSMKLEVVHIYNPSNYVVGEAYVMAPVAVQNEFYNTAELVVDDIKKLAGGRPNINVTLLEGPPAQSILEFAEEHNCDLIMIGSRGLSGIKEFFLGSISHQVVQQSKIPVLVVK